jgi:hypothetical protein
MKDDESGAAASRPSSADDTCKTQTTSRHCSSRYETCSASTSPSIAVTQQSLELQQRSVTRQEQFGAL